jgi:hypothetical protein
VIEPIQTEGHTVRILVTFDGLPLLDLHTDSHPSQIGNTLRGVAKLIHGAGDQADRDYLGDAS